MTWIALAPLKSPPIVTVSSSAPNTKYPSTSFLFWSKEFLPTLPLFKEYKILQSALGLSIFRALF